MKTLYFILAVILLIGMCQDSALISLTAGGTAIGLYFSLNRQIQTKKSK